MNRTTSSEEGLGEVFQPEVSVLLTTSKLLEATLRKKLKNSLLMAFGGDMYRRRHKQYSFYIK